MLDLFPVATHAPHHRQAGAVLVGLLRDPLLLAPTPRPDVETPFSHHETAKPNHPTSLTITGASVELVTGSRVPPAANLMFQAAQASYSEDTIAESGLDGRLMLCGQWARLEVSH